MQTQFTAPEMHTCVYARECVCKCAVVISGFRVWLVKAPKVKLAKLNIIAR